jgi:hypothetical protein
MEPTRKLLIDALCDVLDGEGIYDIQHNTGLSLSRCKEIKDIVDAVKEEWSTRYTKGFKWLRHQ